MSSMEEPVTGAVVKLPKLSSGSHEYKFVLADDAVEPVLKWARKHVPQDPYADPGTDTYRVSTLYFDTEELSVYHRLPNYRNSKFRVRRYGLQDPLYIEEKRKSKGWVRKRRSTLAESDLPLLGKPGYAEWFGAALSRKRLVPQCQTSYVRLARVGETEGKPIRLTVDREILCGSQHTVALPALSEGVAVSGGRTVLELKFQKELPRLFQRLLDEFALVPERSSKYRLAIWLSGLANTAPEERE